MSENLEEFIQSVARGAGDILRSNFGSVRTWRTKSDRGDIVTQVDLDSESYVLSRIKKEFPSHNIVSEESGRINVSSDDCTWFIDPLDGTLNYAMGIPMFCISIGLSCNGELQHGVVYDPIHDELFHAAKGRGAFLNGARITVSNESELSDAIISISWGRRRANSRKYLRYTRKMSEHSSYYRRLGSAALMLSYVASGRIDAYLQGGVNSWDIAAGMLLVTEAGGVVTDLDNQPLDLTKSRIEMLAANPQIHEAMLQHIIWEQKI